MNTSETVEEIPLKKNEIMRLLNASKSSSFKNDKDSLIAKKVSNFKPRSLIEIAEETAQKLKFQEKKINDEIIEKPIINEKEEALEKEVQLEQGDDEGSKLQALEKRIEELTQSNLEKDKQIEEKFKQGLNEGQEKINKEFKERINLALKSLEQAQNLILGINSSQFIELREEMINTIISLASEKAGIEIKKLPEKFYNRIETLIENIDQKTRTPSIFLSKNDFEIIEKYITENSEKKYNLVIDNELVSGDVIIEIGSIKASDTFKDFIDQKVDADSDDEGKESND
tara:strand:- start:211 stop:1068 length:858 start_codon:yes stop_codon:yes gene_type:complete